MVPDEHNISREEIASSKLFNKQIQTPQFISWFSKKESIKIKNFLLFSRKIESETTIEKCSYKIKQRFKILLLANR